MVKKIISEKRLKVMSYFTGDIYPLHLKMLDRYYENYLYLCIFQKNSIQWFKVKWMMLQFRINNKELDTLALKKQLINEQVQIRNNF